MKIVCSGYIVRYPVGGLTWHHLQYLVGFQQLGHEVTFVESYGWENSCFDPTRDAMTGDPSYGVAYLQRLLRGIGLDDSWCYIAQDGEALGMSRRELHQACRDSDLFVDLSNINQIPETDACKTRILVDTDPVFTQVGAHGVSDRFDEYDSRFTYGENVHRPGCTMPTAGRSWLPTRQPVVLSMWPHSSGRKDGPFTTIMSWSPYGDDEQLREEYGQKDRSFELFLSLPREACVPMELAVNAPSRARRRLEENGWQLVNPISVTRTPAAYQAYLAGSRAEFSVAKHGYVSTRCGWFSERSAGYMACGRPVVVQETGFSDWLDTGSGVLPFDTREEALGAMEEVRSRYAHHCESARALVEEYFDAQRVLADLIERSTTRIAVSGDAEPPGRPVDHAIAERS